MRLSIGCHRCRGIRGETCTCKMINEFIKDNKQANIFRNDKGYVIDLIENNYLQDTRTLYAHSIHYAEDVASNWITGIIKINKGEKHG